MSSRKNVVDNTKINTLNYPAIASPVESPVGIIIMQGRVDLQLANLKDI